MSKITMTHGRQVQPRKRYRIFMWFFLAIQVIFLIWLIYALTAGTSPTHAQVVAACNRHQWYPLFNSYADCIAHAGKGILAAQDVGKTIGVGVIVSLWVAADIVLGIGRFVVITARRHRA